MKGQDKKRTADIVSSDDFTRYRPEYLKEALEDD